MYKRQALDECSERGIKEWSSMKLAIRDELSSYIYKKTKRSPMILPVIMEI